MDNKRLQGFEHLSIDTGEGNIEVWKAGQGEPLLLLHGFPQTHLTWHKVAPKLAENFTVILPDLRGYGDSFCPPSSESHIEYSKRKMAEDQVIVMEKLGYKDFYVMGHDRGARVAHQMMLDYPEKVRRCILLDIISTVDMYERTDFDFSYNYYHWFFLIQPDVPEELFNSNPAAMVKTWCKKHSEGYDDIFPEDVLDEYVEKCRRPEVIHGICEDYRAGATCDMEHIRAYKGKFDTPTLVLWSAGGLRKYDILDIWKQRASNVCGKLVDNCGHFIPEQAPEVTIRAARIFFGTNAPVLSDAELSEIGDN